MQAHRRIVPNHRLFSLAVVIAAHHLFVAPAANAMTSSGLDDYDISNVVVPTFVVRSNGVEPTILEPGTTTKWSGKLTSEKFPVRRISSFSYAPKIAIPIRPDLGFNNPIEQPYDASQGISKSYQFLQKQINENISGHMNLAKMQSFAWSACKTHVDYLRVVKKLSRKEIFSVNRSIPLHWGFYGHMRTTHITPSPAEVGDILTHPKAVSYIICKRHDATPQAGPQAQDLATELGEFGLYKMGTLPTRNLSNMQEQCPVNPTLASVVWTNQKGVLTTYVEYRDKYGKVTKGPKRKINTGKANPADGKVITEFMDTLRLPLVKRVPPKPSGPSKPIGGFAAEQRDTDEFLPGDDNDKFRHEGAVRVVIKTGKPVKVSPGNKPKETEIKGTDELKQALASNWIPYLLICQPKVNPGLGGIPGTMTGGAHPTHSNPVPPATGVMVAPVGKVEPGNGFGSQPKKKRFKKKVRTYVDVVIKDAKLSGRSLSVATYNQGTADAQACAVDIKYQTGKRSHQKSLTFGNIDAGKSVIKSTRLPGIRKPTNIQLKARCANEPFGRQANNSKNL